MVKGLFSIGTMLNDQDLTQDDVRLALQTEVCSLTDASFQGARAIQAWADGISPGLSATRFDGTLRGTRQTAAVVAAGLSQFGVVDPGKPYRGKQIGTWNSAETEARGAMRVTYDLADYLVQPGEYLVRFDYMSGMHGIDHHALWRLPQPPRTSLRS